MTKLKNIFSFYLLAGLLFAGFASVADAQRAGDEREVRNIISSLDTKLDRFGYNLNNELSRSKINGSEKKSIKNDFDQLKFKVNDFRSRFQSQDDDAQSVYTVLKQANYVDNYLSNRNFTSNLQNDWKDIRGIFDRLASAYNVSWNWGGSNFPPPNGSNSPNNYPGGNRSNNPPPRGNSSNPLVGTYRLNEQRSENARDVVAQSGGDSISDSNRADLEEKLDAPQELAIDVRGKQVTLASTKSSPVTLSADGQTRSENSGGRTVRVRSAINGNDLTVSSIGGETDYTITFTSIENGNALRVTRRITTEYLNQTIFAESIYDRTDQVARLGINNGNSNDNDNGNYSSNDPDDGRNSGGNSGNYPTTTRSGNGSYIVRDGDVLTAVLDKNIDTQTSQNNDRFRLTVQSPNEYRGAVVEGYLSNINRSGKVSGRSQITFNFDKITMPNGQTYDFAGNLQRLTDERGKEVRVDSEGTARGDNQTNETLKRGGIGAGVGAIIGAIIGGAKGAVIGAGIGGGAGAGSVIVTGKDDLEINAGSTMTIQASSPVR